MSRGVFAGAALLAHGANPDGADRRRGSMASRNGSASATPAPRRTWRRDSGPCVMRVTPAVTDTGSVSLLGLERLARRREPDQRFQRAAVLLHVVDGGGHRRPLGEAQLAAEGVGEDLRRQRLEEQ